MLEEIAKISPAVAFPVFESCFGPVLAIAHFARNIETANVPKVCAARWMIAISMSEPEAGTALTDLPQLPEWWDSYIINSRSAGVQVAGMLMPILFIPCQMPAPKGMGAILVALDAEGLSFGKNEVHMGLRGWQAQICISIIASSPKIIWW